MRVIVTCGPSYEPIDEVRRITNFSTGELGLMLAGTLVRHGHEVTCLRGEGATSRLAVPGANVLGFSTNASLIERLEWLAARGPFGAVLHCAALADFRVRRESRERKLSSRTGELTLTLEPAPKVIARLREMFRFARIVGWKYDLDGTQKEALARGMAQIEEHLTDACVVNGAAYGAGFGFLDRRGNHTPLPDKKAVCDFVAAWLAPEPRRGSLPA
jgi:phosphopantothenoylcysteine synthetase/decarboxylase